MNMTSKSDHLAYILTDKQRLYLTLKYHEHMRPIAIAQRLGRSKGTINSVIKRAEDNLKAAGITPPRERVSLVQKDNFFCATVDPHIMAEMTEG